MMRHEVDTVNYSNFMADQWEMERRILMTEIVATISLPVDHLTVTEFNADTRANYRKNYACHQIKHLRLYFFCQLLYLKSGDKYFVTGCVVRIQVGVNFIRINKHVSKLSQ